MSETNDQKVAREQIEKIARDKAEQDARDQAGRVVRERAEKDAHEKAERSASHLNEDLKREIEKQLNAATAAAKRAAETPVVQKDGVIITEATGNANGPFQIQGSGLGASKPNVIIDGQNASVSVARDSTIKGTVPVGVTLGLVDASLNGLHFKMRVG